MDSIGAQFSSVPRRSERTPRRVASSWSSGEIAITNAARRSMKLSSAEMARLTRPAPRIPVASPDWTSWNHTMRWVRRRGSVINQIISNDTSGMLQTTWLAGRHFHTTHAVPAP